MRGLFGGTSSIAGTVFEDHAGNRIRYDDFFHGKPSIVAFFYTRCNNPQRCSLTITKLARVQRLLEQRNLDSRIHTAAITYDPAFDVPSRIQNFGNSRGLRMDAEHRMLRTTGDFERVKAYFGLGVNFIESLVSRHRVEVYILDVDGRVAASFERIQWDERQVADQAAALLDQKEEPARPTEPAPVPPEKTRKAALVAFNALVSLAIAFFPKCPICWAAYLSVFGIASFQQIPYTPWLLPVFAALMLVNLAGLWWRGRSQRSLIGFYLSAAGSIAILGLGIGLGIPCAAPCGVALNIAGSALGVLGASSLHTRLAGNYRLFGLKLSGKRN
jgi:protein SCO1/2